MTRAHLRNEKPVTTKELDKALDEANARGWTVVDMKNNWKVIYPFQKK